MPNPYRSSIQLPFSSSSSPGSPFLSVPCPSSLSHIIAEYENQAQGHEQTEQEKQEGNYEIQFGNVQEICVEAYVKNCIKPLRMFKDQMELKKQNSEKKQTVKKLEALNRKLKMEYDISLQNNRKMENFLKQIEFTFKNDRSNQKANQTLLKATKTLHRQKQQSKKYIEKLVKTAKTNEMRQLKSYLKVLETEKKRLTQLLAIQSKRNEQLRKQQDFNQSQLECFQLSQTLMTQILQQTLKSTSSLRSHYKKQKSLIKISLTHKQISSLHRQLSSITSLISHQYLLNQGLHYQLQILQSKPQSAPSPLPSQILQKKTRLSHLHLQLKQKIKTQQYLSKWTKQLKYQLQQLKSSHISIKQQYQQEINKLSRQIEQWNRKYKAELRDEEGGKKVVERRVEEKKGRIRGVGVGEVDGVVKRAGFWATENEVEVGSVVKAMIDEVGARGRGRVSIRGLYEGFLGLEMFWGEAKADVYKLARYIVQDNNCYYTKIDPQETIQTSLAQLIFKNLLHLQINYKNANQTKTQYKQFLLKNFDQVRHEIWLNSGKSQTFTLVNLKNALSKYIKQQDTIIKFMEITEYLIWKKFKQWDLFKLTSFQKISQVLLNKKLVKDSQNRISKTTIRSIFDKVYNQNAINIKQLNNNCPQSQQQNQAQVHMHLQLQSLITDSDSLKQKIEDNQFLCQSQSKNNIKICEQQMESQSECDQDQLLQ